MKDDDLVRRKDVELALLEKGQRSRRYKLGETWELDFTEIREALADVPAVQPFHNITMNDVLKYIDDMPEDVWQEFTACLECRGWELQRKIAKCCVGEFALSDLIDRQAAIDAVKKNTFRLTFAEEQNCKGHVAWSANAVYSDVIEGALLELPSVQPEPCKDVQHILDYIDEVLHPIVSPEHWNVYCELHDMIAALPSAQPEVIRCKKCKHWRSSDHTCHEHSLVSPMMANDFCSRAERREE